MGKKCWKKREKPKWHRPKQKYSYLLWWWTNSSSLFHYMFSCGEKARKSLPRAVNEEMLENGHKFSHMQSVSLWKRVINPKDIIADSKQKITFSFCFINSKREKQRFTIKLKSFFIILLIICNIYHDLWIVKFFRRTEMQQLNHC